MRIWGFELRELSFRKFSIKNLWDSRYYLRRERVGQSPLLLSPSLSPRHLPVPLHSPHTHLSLSHAHTAFYQLAILLSLAAEISATYSLSKYSRLQNHIERAYPGSDLYQNDLIGAAFVVILFGVAVCVLWGTNFFFMAQYPERRFPVWYDMTQVVCAVVVMLGVLAGAITSNVRSPPLLPHLFSVLRAHELSRHARHGTLTSLSSPLIPPKHLQIIVANHSAHLYNLSPTLAAEAISIYNSPPLHYVSFGPNIVFVVLAWISFPFVFIAYALLSPSLPFHSSSLRTTYNSSHTRTPSRTILIYVCARHDHKFGPGPDTPERRSLEYEFENRFGVLEVVPARGQRQAEFQGEVVGMRETRRG